MEEPVPVSEAGSIFGKFLKAELEVRKRRPSIRFDL